jgi:hypothetical protein
MSKMQGKDEGKALWRERVRRSRLPSGGAPKIAAVVAGGNARKWFRSFRRLSIMALQGWDELALFSRRPQNKRPDLGKRSRRQVVMTTLSRFYLSRWFRSDRLSAPPLFHRHVARRQGARFRPTPALHGWPRRDCRRSGGSPRPARRDCLGHASHRPRKRTTRKVRSVG